MIKITPHEFKMLQQNYHPDFNCPVHDDDIGDFVENGSGSDQVFSKNMIRKSDNKLFELKVLFNSSGEFIHDEPFDCDFSIDLKKKDTLDPYNELNLSKDSAYIVKELTPSVPKIHFSLDYPIITIEELKSYCKSFIDVGFLTPSLKLSTLNSFIDDYNRPLCEKYNLNQDSLFHSFTRFKRKSQFSKYLENYEKKYVEFHNLK